MVAPQLYAATKSYNSGGALAVAWPSGTQVGDLALITHAAYGTATPVDPIDADIVASGSAAQRYYRRIITQADLTRGSWRGSADQQHAIGIAIVRGPSLTVTAAGASNAATLATVSATKVQGMVFVLAGVGNWVSSAGSTMGTPTGYDNAYTRTLAAYECPTMISTLSTGVTSTAPVNVGGTSSGPGWSQDSGSAANHRHAVVVVNAGNPPNAPTGLTIGGVTVSGSTALDRGQVIRSSWTVSDAEGNAQTAAAVRWRPAGSSGVYTTATRSDATTYIDHPAFTFAGKVELSARTADADGTGPWSAPVTFIATDATPGAASTQPSKTDPTQLLNLTQQLRVTPAALAVVATVSPLTITLPATHGGATVAAQRNGGYTPVAADVVDAELVGDTWVVRDKVI